MKLENGMTLETYEMKGGMGIRYSADTTALHTKVKSELTSLFNNILSKKTTAIVLDKILLNRSVFFIENLIDRDCNTVTPIAINYYVLEDTIRRINAKMKLILTQACFSKLEKRFFYRKTLKGNFLYTFNYFGFVKETQARYKNNFVSEYQLNSFCHFVVSYNLNYNYFLFSFSSESMKHQFSKMETKLDI